MEPAERHRSSFLENSLSVVVLATMTILPLIEIFGRILIGRGISGSIVIVQNLTLWIAILGAVLAARSERLLALSTLRFLPSSLKRPVKIFTTAVAIAVGTALVYASFDFVQIEREFGDIVAWDIPIWLVLSILPVGFAAITVYLIVHAAADWKGRLLASAGLLIPIGFMSFPGIGDLGIIWLALIVIAVATALGMPIFAAIGGSALVLFWNDFTPSNAGPGEPYRLTASPMLPPIP